MTTLSTQGLANTQQIAAKPNSQVSSSLKKDEESLVVSDGQNPSADGKTVPIQSKLVGPEELDKAVSNLNQYVQNIQRDLEFSVDKDAGRIVIKVIDSKSKELIRQIPSQEILDIARALKEKLDGSLLQVKV